MSPRIIHIPLSGGDRKAQAKGIRYAHGIHNSYFKESVLIRSAAEAKIREADRLECEAWNAIMWAGGPAMPSPGEPQAAPTIATAINGGYDFLEAKCNRCDVFHAQASAGYASLETGSRALLRALQRGPARRQRAHILGLTYPPPDPEAPHAVTAQG
jgi:hypothetical protein